MILFVPFPQNMILKNSIALLRHLQKSDYLYLENLVMFEP